MNLVDEILALSGGARVDLGAELFGPRDSVAYGPDLARISSLSRRQPATEQLIRLLSEALRLRPYDDEGQPVTLRPAQAEALCELYECGGIFAPMRVGSGKTLVTLLAPTLLGAQRPVLMVPASLREKTRRDFARYRHNWRVRLPELVSYEEMGRPDREGKLFDLDPDLLVLDEAHRARNLDSAVARRVFRFIDARPATRVAVLSGTLMSESLMQYHHLAVASLRERAPVPLQATEAERWSRALDREVSTENRLGRGAIDSLPGGFHEWFRGSRGVVPTPGSDCNASIEISIWTPDLSPTLRDLIERTAASSMRPDGELLDEWDLPDCLCQLSCGFYYVWDPPPPDEWLLPRRAWRSYAKAVLDEHIDGFDSESQIVNALDGHASRAIPPAPAEGAALLQAWRGVRDTFTPNPVAVWVDYDPLRQAVEHAGDGTLIWVKHRAAGWGLEAFGVPYFPGGTDPESARPGQTIALSIQAHGTGRNLQAWHRSLVLHPPANADQWEQLVGRTHREGQKADTVSIGIIGAIDYHGAVLSRVVTEARAISRASGFSQKILDATWI